MKKIVVFFDNFVDFDDLKYVLEELLQNNGFMEHLEFCNCNNLEAYLSMNNHNDEVMLFLKDTVGLHKGKEIVSRIKEINPKIKTLGIDLDLYEQWTYTDCFLGPLEVYGVDFYDKFVERFIKFLEQFKEEHPELFMPKPFSIN